MPEPAAQPSPVARALAALANRQHLGEGHSADVFGAVMRGEVTPAQLGALLLGLRVKGETAEEVAGAARALRDAMIRVPADSPYLVDTCGTGGGAGGPLHNSPAPPLGAAGGRAPVAQARNPSLPAPGRPAPRP